MLLSRLRPARRKKEDTNKQQNESLKELDQFLEKHDYIGAISLLEHKRQNGGVGTAENDINTGLWLGYCAYHAGDYRKAAEQYEWLLSQKDCPTDVFLYLGCCLFFLAVYDEARHAAERAHKSPLQNRLLFHIAHKISL